MKLQKRRMITCTMEDEKEMGFQSPGRNTRKTKSACWTMIHRKTFASFLEEVPTTKVLHQWWNWRRERWWHILPRVKKKWFSSLLEGDTECKLPINQKNKEGIDDACGGGWKRKNSTVESQGNSETKQMEKMVEKKRICQPPGKSDNIEIFYQQYVWRRKR